MLCINPASRRTTHDTRAFGIKPGADKQRAQCCGLQPCRHSPQLYSITMFKPRYSRADYRGSSPFRRSYSPDVFLGDYKRGDFKRGDYKREDYKREDYERFQRRGDDYRRRFDFDNDRFDEDYKYAMRDYSPSRRYDSDYDSGDYWSRQQRDYMYRSREASPRRFSFGDYDDYFVRDGEEYSRYRERRGRALSRDRGRYLRASPPRRYEDEEYRQHYRLRHRSLSPVPYFGYTRVERSPEEEVRVSMRARSMTPSGRRGVSRPRIDPEHAAYAAEMSSRYRRDNERRRELYKEAEKIRSPPETERVATEETKAMEEKAARESPRA